MFKIVLGCLYIQYQLAVINTTFYKLNYYYYYYDDDDDDDYYYYYYYRWYTTIKRYINTRFTLLTFTAIAGPTLWNSLPEQFRQSDITFRQFKRSLKTFMFG